MKKKSYPIAIILPAYNEALTVENTINAFHHACPEAIIYVVNNNSTDNTALIARKTLDNLPTPGFLLTEKNPGKGNAIRCAFSQIDADIYVLVDADMTYPAHQIRDLMKPILDGNADMVVGNRHAEGRYKQENKRIFHNIGNSLVKFLVNFLFKASLQDIMSGYRVFNRRFVFNYAILVEGFQIETDMTLHALDKRFRIVEIPIEYHDRPSNSFSKLHTFRDGSKVLFTIFKIFKHYKPLPFFSFLACFIASIGLITSIPVFNDWICFHYIYHVPLAILSATLESVALLLMGVGLILDSIAHHYRLEFEKTLRNFSFKESV